MTGLTDVRGRTLTMLRALGIEPEWLTNDDAGIADLGVSPEFEVGRFPIRPVWTGHSYGWEKA